MRRPGRPEILFATDFSAASESASRVALQYAERLGARLHLLHVRSIGETDRPLRLEEIARRLGERVPVVASVRSGFPSDEIVAYAEGNGIDLIVVGTHGRTGFSRVILGSVAERVARVAPCPVLTVPASLRETPRVEAAHGADETREPEKCLVCASPSRDLICEPCRARIRGEAIDRKLSEMRAGRR